MAYPWPDRRNAYAGPVKSHAHGADLVALTRMGWVNCYLVREDDGFTLIDSTLPRGAAAILAAAREIGAPIVRIAITHAHGDHVGSVDELAKRLPDAEVLFPARDARMLRGDRSLDPGEPHSKLRGGYPTVATRATREFAPGERIGSLEVVAAAGHTPGQVAFLDIRDRTLIAGDAFATLGGTAVSSEINPRFPLPALATWDKPLARQTARALRALEPSRLAVGHGRVLADPLPEMDRAIAKTD